MEIKIYNFEKEIKKKEKFIYIIFSDEYILSKDIIKKIFFFYKKKKYKKKFFFIIDKKFNWKKFFLIYNSQTLFKEKKIIELIFIEKDISKFHLYTLYNLTLNINKNNLIIIHFPKLNFRNKNLKYILYFKKKFFYFKVSKNKKNILTWIKNNFKNQKQIINNNTAKYFLKKINNNLLFAKQEIKKFSLIYKTGKISLKKIKKYIIKNNFNDNKLEFKKIFFSKNIINIIKNINRLKKNNISILNILWYLLKKIRIFIKYKTEKKKNFYYLNEKYKLIIKKNKLYNLKLMILDIFKIEQIIKGIKIKNFFSNPWLAIIKIMINLLK